MPLLPDIEIVFKIVFALLITVNLAGNFLVCWVVRRFNSMKTPMNYLLVNLAVSDMMLGIFLIPRELFLGLYEHPGGIAGDILCKFISYGNLSWIGSCAGVYTLIAIAWERYNAIMKPHLSRFSIKQIKVAILCCWVLACFMTIAETVALEYSSKIESCEYAWTIEAGAKIDSALWLVIVGFLPSFVMLGLYGGVIRNLWCLKHKIADVSQRSLQKSRKRVTKAAITVTAILFVCWMPNLLYYFVTSYQPLNSSTADSLHSVSPILYKTSRVLVLLNSSVNPFVYAIQDTRFRTCMKRILDVRKVNREVRQREDTTHPG